MLGDLSGAKSLKLICDVSQMIKRAVDICIVDLSESASYRLEGGE